MCVHFNIQRLTVRSQGVVKQKLKALSRKYFDLLDLKYFPPPQEEKRKKCCYEKTAVQRNDQAVFPVHQPGDPILTPDPETGLV